MTIRDAGEGDLPRILEIEAACFSVPWTEQMLRSQLTPGHLFLAAEAGNWLVGYVGLTYVLDEGYISNVAVSPRARRHGVATALLAELERRARQAELRFLTLEVRESNAAAIALYAGRGYVEAGRRRGYYEKPREDALLMTLRLEPRT